MAPIWPQITDWAQDRKAEGDARLIAGFINGLDAFINTDADTFSRGTINGLITGVIYALLAMGLVLLYKATGIINLAHGGILVVGAYVCASLAPIWPDWLAIVATLVLGALIGWVFYRFAMRPLIGQPLMVTVILTLVLLTLINRLTNVWWPGGAEPLAVFPQGAANTHIILGTAVTEAKLWVIGIALLIFVLVILIFRYTRIGLAMRCVSESHLVSQSMGISVKRIFIITWMLTGAIAAASGILLGSYYSFVSPGLGGIGLFKALPVVLLGGMESLLGAFIGGLIVGLVVGYCGEYFGPEISRDFGDVAAVSMMLVILLIKPSGLFGLKRIVRI